MTALQAHPAAALFPLMSADELARLADDIRENGLRDPVVMHEGLVLDGRNRLAACELADVMPRFEDWDGDGSPTAWVLSKNLHRRHLTPSQMAMVAGKAKESFEAEAKERSGTRTDLSANLRSGSDFGKSAQQAAEACGVSARSVESAAKVLDQGVPELAEAVRNGSVTVSAAAAVADEPEDVQRELVSKGPAAVKRAAKAQRTKKAKAKRTAKLTPEERARMMALPDDPSQDVEAGAEPEERVEFADANGRLAQLVERIDHALCAASGSAALSLIEAARSCATASAPELPEAEQRYQDKRHALVDLSARKRSNRH